jgi:hypothetical protein
MVKRQELDALYKNQKNELTANKETIQKELSAKYEAVNAARGNFIAETDGSGGTGKIGIKDIAIAKRDEYQKLDGEYQALLKSEQPKIESAEKGLKDIEAKIKAEEADFVTYLNNGFLTRIDALSNLLKNNAALQFRYYLIIFILILIQLMQYIAKTLLPSGSYDEKVMRREEMEIELANSNMHKEQQLKEIYNQMAFDNDREAITAFFSLTKDDRNEKMRAFSKKWKDENHQTFDGLPEDRKRFAACRRTLSRPGQSLCIRQQRS